MADIMFLPLEKLEGWLQKLAADNTVFAPQNSNGSPVIKEYDPKKPLVLNREPVNPPKDAVYQQSRALLSFTRRNDPDNPGHQKLAVEELLDSYPAVVFGARPCGVKGFETFDVVFNDKGRITDPYYKLQREDTAFIVVTCTRPGPTCFCNWTAGGPGDVAGADIAVTPVEGGFTAQVLTEKGEKLAESAPFEKATSAQTKEAEATTKAAVEALPEAPDLKDMSEALVYHFEDLKFWEKMADSCIGCGACTYLCPTCYCFNITDESDGANGARMRTWDSCMFATYSLEASGHNPRPTKAHRMRNRISHKYWYHPNRFGGDFSCCGCGRCIRHCPGSVDIRDILMKALEGYNDA